MKSPNLNHFSQLALALCAAIALPASLNAGMEKNPVVENIERPFDWTGFYIGGNLGGVFSEYEFRGSGGDSESHLFSDVDVGQQLDPVFAGLDVVRFFDRIDKDRPDREQFVSAILGGGQVGYQHQFGHWVFGIEGDFDRTSIRNIQKFRDFASTTVFDSTAALNGDGKSGALTINADTDFTGSREAQTNWLGSVRGKFGYATGRLLFYGTAGVVFAGVDVWAHDTANTLFEITEVMDDVPPVNTFNHRAPQAPSGATVVQAAHVANTDIAKDDAVMVGYTAGGGLELAFNDAVTLALEYRHNGFGDETFNFNHHNNNSNGHGGPIFPGPTNLSFDSDQLTVRMNILLNHFFGNGAYTSISPAKNNVAVRSPFGDEQSVQVGYTKAKDADKWSPKDKEITKVEEPFNWTGFYIGANAGGVWTNYDFNAFGADVDVGEIFNESLPFAAPAAQIDAPQQAGPGFPSVFVPYGVPPIDRGSDDSIIGGGQAGYQYQWNHWVFGVEGDFDGLSSSKSTEYVSENFGDVSKGNGAVANLYTMRTATVDWMASARVKIGYARGPVMLYVTGGGAWASVRTWATDRAVVDFIPLSPGAESLSGTSENNSNDKDLVCGWTAGGGAEWAFSKIASLAMEYRHSEFDSADAHYDPHHSAIFAAPYSVDLSSDQVTVRVNLLLGNMGPGH